MTHHVAGLLVRAGALTVLAVLLSTSGLEAAPVEVRFREGVTHGLLALRTTSGTTVALGDLLQTSQGDRVESRMTFHFKDGSLYDETVTFSQQQVFTMIVYRLVQRGPSFPEAVDVSLDRKAAQYTVRSTSNGKRDVSGGRIELPPDVYNGMVAMLLKNLAPGRSETVHVIAFTPTPRLIQVELAFAGDQRVRSAAKFGKPRFTQSNPGLAPSWASSPSSLGKPRSTMPASSSPRTSPPSCVATGLSLSTAPSGALS